jgi:hypothetical protein
MESAQHKYTYKLHTVIVSSNMFVQIHQPENLPGTPNLCMQGPLVQLQLTFSVWCFFSWITLY